MCSKIYIHPLFYVFVFFFLLMGNIRFLLLFMALIFIHECGHFLSAKLLGWNIDKIYLFPYGGLTKFQEKVNVAMKEEFFVLIMGPLFQVLFFYGTSPFLPIRYLSIFTEYHYFILLFNLLPIYPLDGGRLLQLLLASLFPFQKTLRYSIQLSYTALLLLTAFFLTHFSLFFLFVLGATFLKVREEEKRNPYLFQKFLLERMFYTFSFPKRKIIEEVSDMKKDTLHLFRKGPIYYTEKEYLTRKKHDF